MLLCYSCCFQLYGLGNCYKLKSGLVSFNSEVNLKQCHRNPLIKLYMCSDLPQPAWIFLQYYVTSWKALPTCINNWWVTYEGFILAFFTLGLSFSVTFCLFSSFCGFLIVSVVCILFRHFFHSRYLSYPSSSVPLLLHIKNFKFLFFQFSSNCLTCSYPLQLT